MRIVAFLCLWFLALPAMGCHEHSWYREPPSAELLNQLYIAPLPKSSYKVVVHLGLSTAIRLLKRSPFIQISPQAAAKLTDTPTSNWGKLTTYLLRGLRYPNKNSAMAVYSINGKVLIHFGWLGEPGGKTLMAPIVTTLPQPPVDVYMLCTGAT